MGTAENVTYAVAASIAVEDIGYKTMLSITIFPDNMFGGLTEGVPDSLPDMDSLTAGTDAPTVSTGSTTEMETQTETEANTSNYMVPDGIDFPEDYPDGELPIYGEGGTEIAASQSLGDKQMVGYMTESSFQDVMGFYTEKYSNTDGYSMEQQGTTIVIRGKTGQYDFEIAITSNTGNMSVEEKYKTLVQILY
jgi:hypothetical protein